MKNYNKIFFITIFVGILLKADGYFDPIPLKVEVDTQKAALGKKLFHDPILSKDGTISCATCHPLKNYGMDSIPIAIGIDGKLGKRNTPTVLNSGFHFVQFWDGRAQDLKAQVLIPITTHFEMGETIENVINKLNSHKEYKKMFFQIYGKNIQSDQIAEVIAEYEKTLITPNSKFDQYLRGDKDALNVQEKRGLELFKSKGCVSCHHGVNLGANHYQKLGYFTTQKPQTDLGRYNITKKEKDRYFFKVPSLRNIAKTAPYYHNGSTATLYKTVKKMAGSQLGRILNDQEIKDIVVFLETLTGELPNE